MAPKMVMKAKQIMKAMKVMKSKKVMKSQQLTKAMKAPSSKEKEENKLTEACLLKLQGASSQKIEGFLTGLNDKESMSLWKKYEKKRHVEGTQEEYDQAVSGAGKREKSRQGLKVFLKSGTTKSAEHRSLMASLSNKVTNSVEEEWLSLAEAQAKWGRKELGARILTGTILVRHCPDDPRFPEFKAVKHKKKDEVISTIDHKYDSRGAVDKQQVMDFMKCLKNNPNQTLDIDMEDKEQDQPLDVAKHFLNLGNKAKAHGEPLPLQDGPLSLEDQDPEAYINALETASALNDSAGAAKCGSALQTAKTSLENLISQAESVKPESGPGAKKFQDVIKKLKVHFKVIDQLSKGKKGNGKKAKDKQVKAGVVKKVLKNAMKDCKSAQKMINS